MQGFVLGSTLVKGRCAYKGSKKGILLAIPIQTSERFLSEFLSSNSNLYNRVGFPTLAIEQLYSPWGFLNSSCIRDRIRSIV